MELNILNGAMEKSFSEIKMCGSKVVEIKKQSNTALVAFNKHLDKIEKEINSSFASFKVDESNFNSEFVDHYASKTQKLQSTYFDGDKNDSAALKKSSQKLNLLLEASLKIKALADCRLKKASQKFDKKELATSTKAADAIALFTSSINKEVSVLNAQIAFALTREMELSNKVQTYATILSQLQKHCMMVSA